VLDIVVGSTPDPVPVPLNLEPSWKPSDLSLSSWRGGCSAPGLAGVSGHGLHLCTPHFPPRVLMHRRGSHRSTCREGSRGRPEAAPGVPRSRPLPGVSGLFSSTHSLRNCPAALTSAGYPAGRSPPAPQPQQQPPPPPAWPPRIHRRPPAKPEARCRERRTARAWPRPGGRARTGAWPSASLTPSGTWDFALG
jgi:hypothetical protein